MTLRQRQLILGAFDACIVAAAVLTVYLLRFELSVPADQLRMLGLVAAVHVLFNVGAFTFMRLYGRVLQYFSIDEVRAILVATVCAEILCAVSFAILHRVVPAIAVPRSIYLSFALISLGVGGSRLIWRLWRDTSSHKASLHQNRRNLLIFGAGDAGVLVAKELKQSAHAELNPIAFLDDDPARHGLAVMGLPVLGGRERLSEVVKNYQIQDIVISIPSASQETIARLIEACKETDATIKILPSVSDLIAGKISVKMIRDVRVEDLLGREPVEMDVTSIADYVRDQVVLVTGAGGSIGSELCRQIARFAPQQLLLLGHGENSIYEIELELRRLFPELDFVPVIADIQDRQRLQDVFALHRPAVVFHAAAHKHVPLMERNPREAIKNNILGTQHVAECAHEAGVKRFVMISTDKAVNPTSVMGSTKRIAEMIIQGLDRHSRTQFVAVRFGNVLGSRGSVIPVFQNQIQQGGPVTVTHPEMVRFFMTIPEAVQLVIQAGAIAQGGEVFVLDMGAPVKIVDIARDLIRLSGLRPDEDIEIRYSGVRPGEKLYEELLTSDEGTTATRHHRIFIGKPMPFRWEELQALVSELKEIAHRSGVAPSADEIKALIRGALPEYQTGQKVVLERQGRDLDLTEERVPVASATLGSGVRGPHLLVEGLT